MEERRTSDHLKKKFLTYDRIMVWLALAGVAYAGLSFYVRASALPERVESVESRFIEHCSAQTQRDIDRDRRLIRIEDKLDSLMEKVSQ
jgi:hypothetical protein